jgi:hypothetical protein
LSRQPVISTGVTTTKTPCLTSTVTVDLRFMGE